MQPRGLDGVLNGLDGKLQGSAGSVAAQTRGPAESMARAESGGMAGQTPVDAQRKSMGFFDFIKPIAGIAAAVPGPWQPFAIGASALMGGIDQMNSQKAAGGAANAAQGAEGNALASETSLANQLTQQPKYGDILNAEQSGINTFKANQGGVANPGALLKDLQGQNVDNAIRAGNSQQTQNLNSAAGILGQTTGAYNQIGQQAGAAANAGGNPFSGFMNALSGLGIGGGGGGILGGGGPSTAAPGSSAIAGTMPWNDPSVNGAPSLTPNGLPGTSFGGGTSMQNGGKLGQSWPGYQGATANNALPASFGAPKTGY